MSEYVVHGAKMSGSLAVEGTLMLLDLPYRVVESTILTSEAGDEGLAALNPMRQVPALVLPSGELMTESAAILIWLADDHPEARLAPTMANSARPGFLRWMAFVASLYALYWVRDDPSRVVAGEAETHKEAQKEVRQRLNDRIVECWSLMDRQIDPGRYILGDELSVLDLYVTLVSRWAPGRKRFYEAAPKLARIVRRVDADPRLAPLWSDRYPFKEGWEG